MRDQTPTGLLEQDPAALERFLLDRPAMSRTAGAGPGVARERTSRILAELGDPQDAVPAVHVAGTAGKGSVCAFIGSLLLAHGFRVGAQTSPHAYSVRERFRIDGLPIPEQVFGRHIARVGDAVRAVERMRGQSCSFFEVATALGFTAVAGSVDYSIVETGIGGRLDPTNVIGRADKLAVLTTIGLDHVATLGRTREEIAEQKAGILPVRGRAVAATNGAGVDAVLAGQARRRGTRLDVVDVDEAGAAALVDAAGTFLDAPGYGTVSLGLSGRHQAGNAALALHAVSLLAGRDGWELDPLAVRDGLAGTWLPGRFERRSIGGRTVILDGAHDPLKLRSLAATVAERYPGRPVTWVLALARDKDLDESVRAVATPGARIVATELPESGSGSQRRLGRPGPEIAAAARSLGLDAVVEPDPGRALRRAVAGTPDDSPLVVTGSFRLLGAADTPSPPARDS